MKKRAIIIGAGPAGLTAAYELLLRTDIQPVILEQSGDIGGLCKTVNYQGNRMDIGGHRFFSKSDRVMNWWLHLMPLEYQTDQKTDIHYRKQSRTLRAEDFPVSKAESAENVMLIRNRVSRIYYLRKFFSYPLSLSVATLRKLGPVKIVRIGLSYLKTRLRQKKKNTTLEDFFINRFGNELYETFFKTYTEKVWGVPCNQIPAEWGAQRVKELSIGKAVLNALQDWLPFKKNESIAQKDKETSMIERFLYPKYGPGQMWELVAKIIREKGGEIHLQSSVKKFFHQNGKIENIRVLHEADGSEEEFSGDYFFSSMPVVEFIGGLQPAAPAEILRIARGLQYRDFITVGLLLTRLSVDDGAVHENGLIRDNWIYMQDSSVQMGRLQIYNNWSPWLVQDKNKIWLGLEYFCTKGDALWNKTDPEFIRFAIDELASIGFIRKQDVLDSTILRMEKTYPAYFGTYAEFPLIRKYADGFTNLFLVGRNGMHRYNNSDHSMLTAMTAVDNIISGNTGKENIWNINTEQEYHEEKVKEPNAKTAK